MGNAALAHDRARARLAECAAAWSRWRAGRKGRSYLGVRRRWLARFGVDLMLMLAAATWAWLAVFGQLPRIGSPLPFVAVMAAGRIPIYLGLGIYRRPWRTVSRHDALALAGSAVLAVPALAAILYVWPEPFAMTQLSRPFLLLVTEPALYLMLLCGARLCWRAAAASRPYEGEARRVLVIGAGDAGRSLVWQIQETGRQYQVVGFIDDDPEKQGTRILGLPVLGGVESVGEVVSRLDVQQIVIAIPSLAPERLRQVLAACEPTAAPVRILPPLHELIHRGTGVSALREVRMEDLLPRSEVRLDEDRIAGYLRGRTVLVTGGGGSIGGELCRQVLHFGAAQLLVLGRGENSVFETVQQLHEQPGECEVVPIICDVQDRGSLRHVFDTYRPDVVFHAAAHKHVPLMEQHPAEAVKNNVLGTLNVVELAVAHHVNRFVLVSTDKAVDPSSVMGSTKRVAEMIVKGFAVAKSANMVSVRFGNVLGSRGSVVPLMTRQIRNGLPVTVTDPDMLRYFMTIPEAAQLILQAGAVGGRGEVFVLDMGRPVRIIDLACDLIRLCGLVPHHDVPIRIVGRRPGEKLREEILSSDESECARRSGQFYIAPPEPVQLSSLLTEIGQLRIAAKANDKERVVQLLQQVVPAYLPDLQHFAASDTTRVSRAA
jgi:FlaA1/EpsC-like NDP-sugar epimerase